jgi:hypothetical protein
MVRPVKEQASYSLTPPPAQAQPQHAKHAWLGLPSSHLHSRPPARRTSAIPTGAAACWMYLRTITMERKRANKRTNKRNARTYKQASMNAHRERERESVREERERMRSRRTWPCARHRYYEGLDKLPVLLCARNIHLICMHAYVHQPPFATNRRVAPSTVLPAPVFGRMTVYSMPFVPMPTPCPNRGSARRVR